MRSRADQDGLLGPMFAIADFALWLSGLPRRISRPQRGLNRNYWYYITAIFLYLTIYCCTIFAFLVKYGRSVRLMRSQCQPVF